MYHQRLWLLLLSKMEVTDNAVYVTYHGETYTARYSNRKGYDYMFTDKKGKIWYFSV